MRLKRHRTTGTSASHHHTSWQEMSTALTSEHHTPLQIILFKFIYRGHIIKEVIETEFHPNNINKDDDLVLI
jgi:hypothetical protein